MYAAYNDDIGYTALASELGTELPDGSGIDVMHVEASITVNGSPAWMPDIFNAQFSGKNIIDETGATPGLYSGHATGMGISFYGNSGSIAPGVSVISMFLVDHWLDTGFLRLATGSGRLQPRASTSRVANHSWVGSTGTLDSAVLRRVDWLVEEDEFIHVVGLRNGSSNLALLSGAYNTISAGRTDGVHASGSAAVDPVYVAGRTRPDLVTPVATTSKSTAKISSAATLLIAAGHADPALSADPSQTFTVNRAGGTVYNAERSEVIRAALMAGASRITSNTSGADITDYRAAAGDQTGNGLDRRFGAGQLNIDNSYHIIAAGEQNSVDDQGSSGGAIGAAGFDYDPFFGGLSSSNPEASYFFTATPGPMRFIASLVWNLDIAGGSANNFDSSATLHNLDLLLFDVTDPGNRVQVAASESSVENTENIWTTLVAGRDYALQVKAAAGQANFLWDYGLAWNRVPVPAAPLTVDTTAVPNGWKNLGYKTTALATSGGYGQKTWSIQSGRLPPGLTLSESGIISGTITSAAGSPFRFTVRVTDEQADTATQNLIIKVLSGYVCGSCHAATGL